MKISIISFAAAALLQPVWCAEPVDLSVLNRIKLEAFRNSKVMDHLFYLTDVYGPRLTGSPEYRAAAEWAGKRFRDFGLENVNIEHWGPFGRSWSCLNFEAHLEKPQYAPLIGFALPWTPGTGGPVIGQPVLVTINGEEDFPKYKGKLRGAIVMIDAPRAVGLPTPLPSPRLTPEDLAADVTIPDPISPGYFEPPPTGRSKARDLMIQKRTKIYEFLREEGVRVLITDGQGSGYGDIGGMFSGSFKSSGVLAPPAIVLEPEHYNRIARLLDKKIPVEVKIDTEVRLDNGPADGLNVLAEIPGGSKRDEVVMLGAHLDSWTGGTGATDNGAGCGVVIEAMRILKALDLKMDRTVRVALWGGEEEGLLGSKAYVQQHLGDLTTLKVQPEQAKISVYLNYDYGHGKIRGVYLQNDDAARPPFESWIAPLKDLGVATLTNRNASSTDHVVFDAIGIPAFQFIQDPLDYGWRTHHTNMDLYDRLIPGDAMQSAAVLAWLVYDAANAPEMMPRKPMPLPAYSGK